MKTGVIYARYSSDTQTEQSIEGQLRVCNEYAKNNDILILRTYIDRAMTGTNDNRPDTNKLYSINTDSDGNKPYFLVTVKHKTLGFSAQYKFFIGEEVSKVSPSKATITF